MADESVEGLIKKLKHRLIEDSDDDDQYAHEDKLKLVSRLQGLVNGKIRFNPAKRAKKAFRKIMRLKPEDRNRDKRMPHKEQLKILKAIDPALSKTLRDGSVRDFYNILYPKPKEDLQGTVFCWDGTESDYTVFEDLTERAKLLAKEIRAAINRRDLLRNSDSDSEMVTVKCYLMDGHGRMFLCLIKALLEEHLDPDNDVQFIFCEIDDDVHEYQKYVFPSKVTKLKQNVLEGYGDYVEPSSVVYLNFCSIPSSQDPDTWNETRLHPPRCFKENVLKFVAQLTQPSRNCSVMVSLVIRDSVKAQEKLFPPISKSKKSKKYITGLGFLKVIRDPNLFNSTDEDILLRPDGIPWEDQAKRQPKACGLNGRDVLVFASVMVHPFRPSLFTYCTMSNLEIWFQENNIDVITPDDIVKIVSKQDSGKHALVKSRTQKSARVVLFEGEDYLPKAKAISSLTKLPESQKVTEIRDKINARLTARRQRGRSSLSPGSSSEDE